MKDNYIMKYKNALTPNEQQIKEFTEGDCVPVDKNDSPSLYNMSLILAFT